ncbi:MAG TPA: anti-sigma factor [Gammaproteobacteria bacterium]|nr:anti-sigma factor [Gammaproteobacteria bacterium]
MSPASPEHLPGVRPGRGDAATRDAVAGEYALGTLAGPARRRFERLLAVDADLRRRVRAWEARLAPLAEEAEPVAPPPQVWAAVERRLGLSGGGTVHHLWHSLPLWRGLAVAATVLLAVVSAWSWQPTPMTPERMVVVTNPSNDPVWVVSSGGRKGMVRVRTLRPSGMPAGRVCPLWLKWGKQGHMYRVAVLPERRGVYTFHVPRDMPMNKAHLMVSVESAGDVPTDGPRGKVVYTGSWIRL